MAKVALLIGVSEYESGLKSLPGTQKDIEEMQGVLKDPNIGNFDEVRLLTNPNLEIMQVGIQTLFSERQKDDLLVLYFSGHGIIDNYGKLYMASCGTSRDYFESTAVAANFVHDIMNKSCCKRQVVILDCCYSGAFAQGLSAKNSGLVDIETQLGGEGRVILTSCRDFEYSLEKEGVGIYTRYLVEGIKTGAADTNNDGVIYVDKLHEYAKKKVQETAPSMKSEIYAVKEGYKIKIAKAPLGDPKFKYRKEVEQFVKGGKISTVSRRILNRQRDKFGLTVDEAIEIENEVLKPYKEYQENLQEYEQALLEAIENEGFLNDETLSELKHLQRILQIQDEDIAPIYVKITAQIKSEFANKKYQNIEINISSFNEIKLCLILMTALIRLRQICNKINLENSVILIDQVMERLGSKSFSIAVFGELNRGKTTLINALLGEEILPSDIDPCSATLTRVTYSINSFVEVEFKDGRKKNVAIDKLADYVTKLTPEAEAIAANVKEAVVYYPANFCKNNVDIIDTPGLNYDPNITEVILSVLPKVDAAILVIMAQSPFSEMERDFLENKLLTNDLERVIFVVTGIDRCAQPGDADKVIASVTKRIKQYVLGRAAEQWGKNSPEYKVYSQKIGEAKVFGLSAYQALEAKSNNDNELLVKSRFLEFEAALKKFIATERETIRLQIAVNGVIVIAKDIMSIINTQDTTLDIEIEEMNKMRLETKTILKDAINICKQVTAINNNN
ncbi:MAG: dynamin family protein [Nostocaceae cyanobacterium]|nr:dynamin family protein [Nostocaceae cyanobacterium]